MNTKTKNIVYISIFILAAILLGRIFFSSKDKNPDSNVPLIPKASIPDTEKNNEPEKRQSTNEPPLKLKSIGVNLDAHDPVSNRAGDFVFTKGKLQFDRIFMGYGFFIPMTGVGPGKKNPQPAYVLPLGTPVRSLVDGIVANISTVWSGDFSIMVTEDGEMGEWIYEVEHVINPRVKVGDRVSAGQIIGEVSDFDKWVPAGFGVTEIGILKSGNPPSHICPFAYLDESIKEETFSNLKSLMNAWEDYRKDPGLYDEITEKIPGCLTLDSIEG